MASEIMARCDACGTPYTWRKSTSRLKFSACSIFCERRLLGCTIDDIMAVERNGALHAAHEAIRAAEAAEWQPDPSWEEVVGCGHGHVPDMPA